MKRRLGLLSAAAVLAVAAAVIYLMQPPRSDSPRRAGSENGAPHGAPVASGGSETSSGEPSPAPAQARGNLIDELFARLKGGAGGAVDLNAFRKQLLAMNPEQAAAMIRKFLETGQDAPTPEEFMVGAGGALTGAPTFRTLLLDLLGQIGRKTRDPSVAAVSKKVMEQKTSSDEWAVALRNVAWMEPQSKPYLATKMREMLAYEPWRAEPSAGMLEAFDVMVFTGDPAFIPDLVNMLSSGSDALRRASAVALDRLSEMAPLEVMNHLNANPTELGDKPFLRADYFAKADFTNPAQRAALETYLSRSDVSNPEKAKLLNGLATPASFVSENLVTQPAPPPSAEADAARQKQLSILFGQWEAQNRFPQLRGELAKVRQRLGQ